MFHNVLRLTASYGDVSLKRTPVASGLKKNVGGVSTSARTPLRESNAITPKWVAKYLIFVHC